MVKVKPWTISRWLMWLVRWWPGPPVGGGGRATKWIGTAGPDTDARSSRSVPSSGEKLRRSGHPDNPVIDLFRGSVTGLHRYSCPSAPSFTVRQHLVTGCCTIDGPLNVMCLRTWGSRVFQAGVVAEFDETRGGATARLPALQIGQGTRTWVACCSRRLCPAPRTVLGVHMAQPPSRSAIARSPGLSPRQPVHRRWQARGYSDRSRSR